MCGTPPLPRDYKEDFKQLLLLFAAVVKDAGVLKINNSTLVSIDINKVRFYRLDLPDHVSFALTEEEEGGKKNG